MTGLSAVILPETFISVSRQTELFLLSVVLGVGLGAVYDIFRALRAIFPPLGARLPTAVCDVIYLLICGVCIYLFSLFEAGGRLRGYYWAGAALGAAIYLLTAGSLVIGVIRAVFSFIRKAAVKLSAPFVLIFRKIITKKSYNFVTNAKKLFPNCKNNKKDLKKSS